MIAWHRVTWYSVVLSILFLGAFLVGAFRYGMYYDALRHASALPSSETPIADARFLCAGGRSIHARFFPARVLLELSDGRSFPLPQTISASGARYSTMNESFVFWNKGSGAFIEERGSLTYRDCLQAQ
jgi:membrane-bound inhibitor of C-type lysozyme